MLLESIKKSVICLGVLLLSGCAMPHMQLESLDQLKNNEVIYIGSVSLDPNLKKDEVIYKNVINLGDQELHRTLYIKASDVYYELEGKHGFDIKSSVAGQDGENYYFSWEKDKPLYLLGVSFFTRWTSTNRETMTLVIGNGIQVEHEGNAKAVYVGDITFERDEFFNIKDIKISQKGYKEARKAFWDKYGTQMKVDVAKLYAARE